MSGEDQWKDRLADGIEIDDSLLFDDNEGSGASQGQLFACIPETIVFQCLRLILTAKISCIHYTHYGT